MVTIRRKTGFDKATLRQQVCRRHQVKAKQRISNYILEEKLGVGGAGEVWRGKHKNLDKSVAIKVLHPQLSSDPKFKARFLREAKAMAQLGKNHFILDVIDFFTEKGNTFLVMPYLEGGSLRDEINKRGRFPVEEALRITEEILDALNFAHQQGIIHRDIKPSNILLSNGHVKVADFGIAKLVGEKSITSTGSVMGTIEYMSPEQIKGTRDLDHTSDEYSCACVCYEMLTGQPPFGSRDDSTSEYDIMHAHINESPQSIRDLNPEVDAHTEAVVLRALSKNPDDRYGGCKAMQQALLSVDEELPVFQPKSTKPNIEIKKPKRNEYIPVLIIVILTIIIYLFMLMPS